MNIYDIRTISEILEGNTYAGRGIITGKSADGKNAVAAYFIMGRSDNSRNRVFACKENDVYTEPFDASKVEDPSLIIYAAVRSFENKLIVTNGDQTDTIYDYLKAGKSFNEALATREFEPDAPNFTPRISSLLTFGKNDFSYDMSILKSADEKGSACVRFSYSFPSLCGLGHFIHTYVCDGNPLPSFSSDPERVYIPDDIDAFSSDIWNALDENNRISLFVRYISLEDGTEQTRIINKNN